MSSESNTVVVAGANRGMGLEYARQYAADGWRVFATARNPAGATALNQAAAQHHELTVHELDLASSQSVERFADELKGAAIDVLLCNASHMVHLEQQSFESGNADLFAQSFEVNAIGPFRLAQALIENVRRSEQKKLVFMGSTAGSTGSLQPPVKLFAYCPAKAALNSMARGLHLNLAPEGITVGLLEPGVVDTQGFANIAPGEAAPYGMDVVVEMVREGKLEMAKPADAVAALRKIIASLTPESGGQLIRVDGKTIPW